MWFVYLVRCADGTLYVGRTTDLASREMAHNSGHGAIYTATRRPVRIVYAEEHISARSAATREQQLKRWTSQKKEQLVAGDIRSLKVLSQRRGSGIRVFTWKDLMKLVG
jgi:putative endonuclease